MEDEEGLRKLVQRILHEAGYEVLLACESVNALRLWHAHRIDLLVADLGLPGRSGLETVIEMRAQEPSLPIIVISGRGEEELVDLLTGAGLMSGVRTVNKPFEAEQLLDAVQQGLGSPPDAEQS